MSNIQTSRENLYKDGSKIVHSVIGLMLLKWVVILSLNRWARSLK